jgi:hypothetical protein
LLHLERMQARRLLLALSILACGGQTSTGTDAGPDSPADVAADTGPIILPSPSDVCDGDPNLTGNHVLSILQPYYAATYTPMNGSPSALQLFVSTTSNPTITCHPHVVSNGGPPDMPASISVAVQATFATQDKTFNEVFAATVTLSAAQSSQSLAFAGTEPTSSIQGTYQPTITGTWMSHVLSFSGAVLPSVGGDGGPGSTTGSVTEQASNTNMGKVMGAGSWK